MGERNLEKEFEGLNGALCYEILEVASEVKPLWREKKMDCGMTEHILKCLKKKRHRLARVFREYAAVGLELGMEDAVYDELLRLLKIYVKRDEDFGYKTIDLEEEAEQLITSCTQETDIKKPSMNQNVGVLLTEIQHMRCLLDVMERNIQWKLTGQDVAEMEQNRASWMKDIEKLKQMIGALSN